MTKTKKNIKLIENFVEDCNIYFLLFRKCQNDRLVFNTRKAITDNSNAIKENKKTNKEQDKEIKFLKEEIKELRKNEKNKKKEYDGIMNRLKKLEEKDVANDQSIKDLQKSTQNFEESTKVLWERNAIIDGQIELIVRKLNNLATVTTEITQKLNYEEELKKLKEPLKLGRDHTSFCDPYYDPGAKKYKKDNVVEEGWRWLESAGKFVVDRNPLAKGIKSLGCSLAGEETCQTQKKWSCGFTEKGSNDTSTTEKLGCKAAYTVCSKGVTLDAVNECCIVHDDCFEHSDYDSCDKDFCNCLHDATVDESKECRLIVGRGFCWGGRQGGRVSFD